MVSVFKVLTQLWLTGEPASLPIFAVETPVFHQFTVILPFWPKDLLLAYQNLSCDSVAGTDTTMSINNKTPNGISFRLFLTCQPILKSNPMEYRSGAIYLDPVERRLD